MNYYIGLVPFASEPYLAHYGVKGMKWGIRRYQNTDGTLTPEGIKRYRGLVDEGIRKGGWPFDNARKEYVRKAGIKVSSGDTDIIPKGTKFNRASSKDEEIDERIKYVSVTPDDKERYESSLSEGFIGDASDHSGYGLSFEAKRDLKVANANAIMGYMLDKYGDMTIKEASKSAGQYAHIIEGIIKTPEISQMKVRDMDTFIKSVKKESNDAVSEAYRLLRALKKGFTGSSEDQFMLDVIHTQRVGENLFEYLFRDHVMDKKESSELIKEMRKRGYDAMIDLEDTLEEISDYPLILLNPQDSVKKLKSEKLYGGGDP